MVGPLKKREGASAGEFLLGRNLGGVVQVKLGDIRKKFRGHFGAGGGARAK